jgi:outer membrane protein assembly factor BamB
LAISLSLILRLPRLLALSHHYTNASKYRPAQKQKEAGLPKRLFLFYTAFNLVVFKRTFFASVEGIYDMENREDQFNQESSKRPAQMGEHELSQQSPVARKRRKNPLATPRGILFCSIALVIVCAGAIFVGIKLQVPSGREKWSLQIGGASANSQQGLLQQVSSDSANSSPTIINGIIYIGDSENKIYALHADSGKMLWSTQLGNYTDTRAVIVPTPVVANNVIYSNSQNSYVYALDASTGQTIWSYNTGYVVRSAPVLANGIIYVGTDDDTVYALDAHSGHKIWSAKNENFFFFNTSPAEDHGLLYIAGFDGNIYALDAASGQEKWHTSIGKVIGGSYTPIVVNGAVYITTLTGKIVALNAVTGQEKWSSSQATGFTSSPVVSGNIIYVYSFIGLFALDIASGRERWFHDMPGSLSAPVVAGGTVYVGANDSNASDHKGSGDKLYALDAHSGNEQWFYQLDSRNDSSPVVSNGVIYISALGKLYAILPPG